MVNKIDETVGAGALIVEKSRLISCLWQLIISPVFRKRKYFIFHIFSRFWLW